MRRTQELPWEISWEMGAASQEPAASRTGRPPGRYSLLTYSSCSFSLEPFFGIPFTFAFLSAYPPNKEKFIWEMREED